MNTINLAPFLDPLIQIGFVVLLGLLVPAVNKFAAFFAARTHIVLSRQATDTIEAAVSTAATMLQTAAVQAGSRAVLHVSSPEMAVAVNHVVNSVPDALEHLGVSPDTIANKVLARVLSDPFFDGAAKTPAVDQAAPAPFVPVPAVPVAVVGQPAT